MRKDYNPRSLMVEGQDDLFSVVSLMDAHIDWPDGKENAPVSVVVVGSVSEILDKDFLSVQLKSPVITVLGVMLDADIEPANRYERFRSLCVGAFPALPERMPEQGLICDNDDGKRLGLWIMPDNVSEGCIENFLRHLVPDEHEQVWAHAVDSVTKAREVGAACRDAHVVKANLYTWLAWQDSPGQSPGRALTQKILDPVSPYAASFVAWFRDLYGV